MDGGRLPEAPDRIIRAITEKLEANRGYLAKSKSGQITWRITNGKVEVFIQPKI